MNGQGYILEVDPYSKSKKAVKRTALGRFAHESAAFSKPVAGQPIAAYMGDDSRNEYIYKFVSTALWSEADANPADRLATGAKYLDQGKLFVAKSFLAAFLILTIGLVPTTYPFLPRHLTLLSFLTVGIPAFFLALAPSTGAWKARDYLGSTFRFALPAGVAAGLGVVSAYLFSLNVLFDDVASARTVAVTALMAIGLWLVLVLEVSGVKRSAWVIFMCLAMAGMYVAVILVAPLREFFELTTMGALSVVVAISGAAITASGLWMLDRQFRPEPLRGPLPRWLARLLPESFRADPEGTKPGD